MKIRWMCLICTLLLPKLSNSFDIFPKSKELIYEYHSIVTVGSLPADPDEDSVESNVWSIDGLVYLQRQVDNFVVAKFIPQNVNYSDHNELLGYRRLNKLQEPFNLFLINGTVNSIILKAEEPEWSGNIKKAIASALQIHGDKAGAFVINEGGLNGFCATNYYVSTVDESSSELVVQKTPELTSCRPFVNGIHQIRSNLPVTPCKRNDEFNFEENVVVGIESEYTLKYRQGNDYRKEYILAVAGIKSQTTVHTFENNGESHHITSSLNLKFKSEQKIVEPINVELLEGIFPSTLDYITIEIPKSNADYSDIVEKLLMDLVDSLERQEIDFDHPYDDTVAEIFRMVGLLNETELIKLYKQFEIGTSYRQETAKNLFLEILPRVGSKASVILIHDLVVNKRINPTTAVQLLVSMPFYVTDLSYELVKSCETFLLLGPDRPDVKDAAVLSFATLIYKTHVAGQMTSDQLNRYVKRYFDFFIEAYDYEQQILYIQALGNLQLGSVAQYLAPIIRDQRRSTDLRYLAMWATMPSAHLHIEHTYETFWPIFEKKSNPLELRITAFLVLLISNPSPGRLLSLHRILMHETSSHFLNFYRTTVTSMSSSTYPCHQNLRRTLAYMRRHLPKHSEPKRFWVSGNYIVDYKDTNYGNAGLLQAMLIGDEFSDVPYIGYFKIATEALGRITGQVGVSGSFYVKSRGISDTLLAMSDAGITDMNITKLKKILDTLKLKTMYKTPLHLEFILQNEGKTVLSYYLNSTTLNRLNGVHFNTIFSGDSHINMQTVRWPFMTKHILPTALGTPIDLTVQSTILSTLRGNVSQVNTLQKFSSEIDIRYSTYSALSSNAYNPFLNLDHIIRREQGTMVYLPFNNEFSLDILGKSLFVAFKRPENLVNGFAVKSRTISKTEGFIDYGTHFLDEKTYYGNPNNTKMEQIVIPVNDLGIALEIKSTEANLNSYLNLFTDSEIQENMAVISDIEFSDSILRFLSTFQLNAMHFGTDKHFQLLMRNNETSLLELTVKGDFKVDNEKTKQKLNLHLAHKKSFTSPPDIEWSLLVKNTEIENVRNKITAILKRVDNTDVETIIPKDFKACARMVHEPMVFLIKPDLIDVTIVFGFDSNHTSCPNEAAKLEMKLKRDISPLVKSNAHQKRWDESVCPSDILKFSPPPYDNVCAQKDFKFWSTISYYEVDVKYQNLPFDYMFKEVRDRLSYGISALLPDKIELLNLTSKFHLVLHSKPDTDDLEFSINDRRFDIPHVFSDFKLVPSIKYDTDSQYSIDYGFIQQCSIIDNRLSSFDNEIIPDIDKHFEESKLESCSTLLLADCSDNPVLAVFLDVIYHSGNRIIYGIKVHAGGNFIQIHGDPDSNLIWLKDAQNCMNFTEKTDYFFPITKEEEPQIRAYMNEGLIFVEHEHVIFTKIQFNGRNSLSIQTPRVQKRSLCGLCNYPVNVIDNYNYCGHEKLMECNNNKP